MSFEKTVVHERLLMILKSPYISEKGTMLANKFKEVTFKVLKTATKSEVKEAVELIFNVKVKRVCVLNVKGKTKKFRQRVGKRKDWKKAYVALKEGYDINFDVTE